MRKCLLFLFFAALAGTLAAGAAPFRFADRGKSDCVIVLPEKMADFDAAAARDLQFFLEKMCGARLPIIDDADDVRGRRAIWLGDSAAAKAEKLDKKLLKPEEWVIASPDGKNLILTGGGEIGTFYAVWALLNHLGCYALTPDQDAVAANQSPVYSGKFERRAPVFESRLIYDRFPCSACETGRDDNAVREYYRWTLRNRINGRQYFKLFPLYTHGANHMSHDPQHHSLCCYLPETMYDTHPEYFSMDESGKRCRPLKSYFGGGLCLSNPEVSAIFLKSLKEMIAKDRSSRPGNKWLTIYDISLLDAQSYICLCPQCKEIAAEEKGETGLLLRFLNHIVREIRKEYPDIQIRTLAYGPAERPPVKTMPDPAIIIEYCDKFSQCDPFRPLSHPLNQEFKKNFDAWYDITPNVMVWDYWNLGMSYFTPARVETVFDAIQPDFRYFRDKGSKHIFIECERDNAVPQNFIDCVYFVGSALMADPDADTEKLAEIFFTHFYGPAAKDMMHFFKQVRAGVAKQSTRVSTGNGGTWEYASPQFLLETLTLLKKNAEALPAGSVYRKRVEFEMIPVLWSILSARAACEKLFREHGMTMDSLIAECRRLAYAYIHRFPAVNLKPVEEDFEKRFLPCAQNFRRPEKFAAVPAEDFRMLAFPDFNEVLVLGSKVAEDPDSELGKALKAAHPSGEWHGVNKTIPGKHNFITTHFQLENQPSSKGKTSLTLTEVPQDEKYHWFKLDKSIELQPVSYFWGQGWAIQGSSSRLYSATGKAADNHWDEIWVSVKFTGPAYVPGSAKENAIWVDRVVLTRKKK